MNANEAIVYPKFRWFVMLTMLSGVMDGDCLYRGHYWRSRCGQSRYSQSVFSRWCVADLVGCPNTSGWSKYTSYNCAPLDWGTWHRTDHYYYSPYGSGMVPNERARSDNRDSGHGCCFGSIHRLWSFTGCLRCNPILAGDNGLDGCSGNNLFSFYVHNDLWPKSPEMIAEEHEDANAAKNDFKLALGEPIIYLCIVYVFLFNWLIQGINDLTPGYFAIPAPVGVGFGSTALTKTHTYQVSILIVTIVAIIGVKRPMEKYCLKRLQLLLGINAN